MKDEELQLKNVIVQNLEEQIKIMANKYQKIQSFALIFVRFHCFYTHTHTHTKHAKKLNVKPNIKKQKPTKANKSR